jgi:hypothetical protein
VENESYVRHRKFPRVATTTDMTIPRLILVCLVVLGVAGCGSGGRSASGGGSEDGGSEAAASGPNGGGGVNGISVSNCLNLEDFLVQPSQTTIDGTSPNGVSFSLVFYGTEDAAKEAYGKKNPKTSALVENAVVDFKGNPSPYEGAPPAKISNKEIKVIQRCIDENKESA